MGDYSESSGREDRTKAFLPREKSGKILHRFFILFLINISSAVKKLEKVDWNKRYPIKFLLLLAAMQAQRMCIQPDVFLKCTLQTMD